MKKKSTNFYQKQINLIKKARQRNNNNWMDLMKLAFKSNPSEAKKIVKRIFVDDGKINKLVKRMIKSQFSHPIEFLPYNGQC